MSESPGLEAEVLLAQILSQPRTWIVTHPEFDLEPVQQDIFRQYVVRLRSGEALPYVIGHQEFYGRRFDVTSDVLIPRPETEHLIDEALARLSRQASASILDVGTGSGCIAITLALELADQRVVASDISFPALQIAAKNAALHEVIDRVSLVQGDALTPFAGPFAMICANLPYIDSKNLQTLAVAEREPSLALDGGVRGTSVILNAIQQLSARLMTGGWTLFEIDPGQSEELSEAVYENFKDCRIELIQDFSGLDRLLIVQKLDA